jgi:AcrR family transcriptional regulator
MATERDRRSARVAQRAGDPAPRPSAVNRLGGMRVSEMQRSRLLAAAVGAVEQRGYHGASVAHITERARVSRRTFYELFENREECLLAVLESTFEQIVSEIAAANLTGLSWRERVRGGLWVILCFFDREPALARLCVVESQRAGEQMLDARDRTLERLARIVDEGRRESVRSSNALTLTAQGVVGAVLSILHARLARSRREPLQGLLGELTGMIVLPYLGAGAARREQERPAPAPVPLKTAPTTVLTAALAALPMRLTYRTAKVIQCIAEHPGISNRQVADHAGIHDQGQISKLLSRLERLQLAVNTGEGAHLKGESNAWKLTPTGWQIAREIGMSTGYQKEAA